MARRLELLSTASALFVRQQGDAEWWAFTPGAEHALAFAPGAPPPAGGPPVLADAIYGAFQILDNHFLAVVTSSRRVAVGPYGVPIYQATEMQWLPVQARPAPQYALTPREAEDAAV